jgi:hypothetical protein
MSNKNNMTAAELVAEVSRSIGRLSVDIADTAGDMQQVSAGSRPVMSTPSGPQPPKS